VDPGHLYPIQPGAELISRQAMLMKWLSGMMGCIVIGIIGFDVEAATESMTDCIACHRERNPILIAEWEQSGHHRPALDCQTCHGTRHDGTMAAHSRRNEVCMACHARERQSYTLSKHGVIALMEGERMAYPPPSGNGEARAPTCAYCHMHRNTHRMTSTATPCQDCHSPRFVDTWFTSGRKMIAIGAMKVREAEAVVHRLVRERMEGAFKARRIHEIMTRDHLGRVRLGVGHQSPDDQWWHGQPALDGDLLRIKSILHDALIKR